MRIPCLDYANIYADIQLRKGPHHQATVTWMNAVQTHLDDFTSWDFLLNKTFGAITHTDAKVCQVARINPRHIETHFAFHMKDEKAYIEEDLKPAIALLCIYERARLEKLGIIEGADPNATAEPGPSQSKTRRHRKKREPTGKEKKVQGLVGELQSLRRLVDERDMVGSDINERLHGVEKQILELAAGQT